MTQSELLKLFPDHKPTVYHVDMQNNIEPVFTYYDRLELEGRLLDDRNKNKLQGELFL